jgi:hypothetical protein
MVLRGSRPARHGIHGMGGGLDPCSDMDCDGGESVEATVCKHEATEMLVSGQSGSRPMLCRRMGERCRRGVRDVAIALLESSHGYFSFARGTLAGADCPPLGAERASLLYARHASPSPPSGFTCGSPIAPCA